ADLLTSTSSAAFFLLSAADAEVKDLCGTAPLRKPHTRIIGGEDAPAGVWPWQASVNNNSTLCGGSLISRRWVLTAARCLSRSADNVVVFLGRDTQMGPNPHEVTRWVSKVIQHPDYDPGTHKNDLGLLRLSTPVNFTDYIRPVCLAAKRSFFVDGLSCWVTGWGAPQTHAPLPPPQRLQQVSVPIVSNIQCNAAYGTGKVTTRMMCAGPDFRGKGFCEGDFGGPLVVSNGNRWIQAGVASFVTGCGYPDYPGVYTRVSRYQTWINNHTGEEQPGYVYFWSSASRTSPFIAMFSLLAATALVF
uniref:Peptidase S1 domain-containing protein n=1 Tax=Oryzias latipes TaxID=8090 RepID=A0A3P9LBP1_ORYLA